MWTGLYILAYAVLSLGSIRISSAIAAPRWKLGLETLTGALGTAGMIFHWREAVTPAFADVWKVVFPLLFLGHVVDGAWDLRKGYARVERALGTEEEGEPHRVPAWIALLAGLLFAAPCLYLNYRVAFG